MFLFQLTNTRTHISLFIDHRETVYKDSLGPKLHVVDEHSKTVNQQSSPLIQRLIIKLTEGIRSTPHNSPP